MTEQTISQYDTISGSPETADLWRNELQDRLARYKRRRGRRIEGAYTMRFPFPAENPIEIESSRVDAALPAPVEPAQVVADAAEEREEVAEECVDEVPELNSAVEVPAEPATGDNNFVLEPPPQVEEEDVPFVDPIVRPRPKRKVIAFPKHLSVAPEVVQRLADPVTAEVPRILDVPEELEAIPATPFLDGLQLELPSPAEEAARREHVDLPCQPVKPSQRMLAGAVDLTITAAAAALFAAAAYRILNNPPLSKFLIVGLLAGSVVLWTTYQYLFVVHAGKTLGMMAARMRLRTFKGKPPTMQQRRNRVLSLYLSSLSLGMGLMWALVDVDGLCWHDRLSRTYLARRKPPQ